MDEATTSSTHIRSQIGAFGMLPEWLLKANISSTAKVVFAWLACRYANRSDYTCWPGQARLADDLRVHPATIQRAITELVTVGALRRERQTRGFAQPSTNLYTLIFIEPATHEEAKTLDDDAAKTRSHVNAKTPSDDAAKTPPKQRRREEQEEGLNGVLITSPLQFAKRHGGHISGFCDWVCLPEDVAMQFATRSGKTVPDIVQWAQSVRAHYVTTGDAPVGNMWEFWGREWDRSVKQNESQSIPGEGPVARAIRLAQQRKESAR